MRKSCSQRTFAHKRMQNLLLRNDRAVQNESPGDELAFLRRANRQSFGQLIELHSHA
jgi:hypothetical protein